MSDCATPDEQIRDLVREFAPGLPAATRALATPICTRLG